MAQLRSGADGRITVAGGADVILDMVGGPYIERNLKALADDGRLVQIAFLRGAKATVNFTRLMLKRLVHTGSTLRARPADEKARLAARVAGMSYPELVRRVLEMAAND